MPTKLVFPNENFELSSSCAGAVCEYAVALSLLYRIVAYCMDHLSSSSPRHHPYEGVQSESVYSLINESGKREEEEK
jgi:hypothetical protein